MDIKRKSWPFWVTYFLASFFIGSCINSFCDANYAVLLTVGMLNPIPFILLGGIATRFKWQMVSAILTFLISVIFWMFVFPFIVNYFDPHGHGF